MQHEEISMAKQAASAQRIAIAERRRMALDLRRQGGSYRRIAETLRKVPGVSERYCFSQAQRDVTDELGRLNEGNRETASLLKRLELERLDELWQTFWPEAIAGNLRMFDRIMRIMERRARLEGLDAPTAVRHSGDPERPVKAHAAFTIKIDRRAEDDLISIDTLETAGAVPIGTVATLRAALVALDPDPTPPATGLLSAPGRDGKRGE